MSFPISSSSTPVNTKWRRHPPVIPCIPCIPFFQKSEGRDEWLELWNEKWKDQQIKNHFPFHHRFSRSWLNLTFYSKFLYTTVLSRNKNYYLKQANILSGPIWCVEIILIDLKCNKQSRSRTHKVILEEEKKFKSLENLET